MENRTYNNHILGFSCPECDNKFDGLISCLKGGTWKFLWLEKNVEGGRLSTPHVTWVECQKCFNKFWYHNDDTVEEFLRECINDVS